MLSFLKIYCFFIFKWKDQKQDNPNISNVSAKFYEFYFLCSFDEESDFDVIKRKKL